MAKNLTEFLSIRLSKKHYSLLLEWAAVEGYKDVGPFARDILVKYITSKPSEIVSSAISDIHSKQNELSQNLNILTSLFSFYLNSWFAHMPEFTAEEADTFGRLGAMRKSKFIDLFYQEIARSPDFFESLLLRGYVDDSGERKPNV